MAELYTRDNSKVVAVRVTKELARWLKKRYPKLSAGQALREHAMQDAGRR